MYMLKRTSLFKTIESTIKRHKRTYDDIEEAENVAWDDRRFALKSFLTKNKEDMEKFLSDNDEEDDSNDY